MAKGRNKIWESISTSSPDEVEIMYETDSYKEIINKEIEFIKLYGKKTDCTGTLANLSDGGEGSPGIKNETSCIGYFD